MKIRIALVLLTTVLGNVGAAEEIPQWLRDKLRESQQDSTSSSQESVPSQNEDVDRKDSGGPSESPSSERAPAAGRSFGGPFLEEFIILPNEPIETVADRERELERLRPPVQDVEPTPAVQSEVELRYRVQPSDVLNISVWREPELASDVVVSPDGWITFPLVGEIEVENNTLEEIRHKIEVKLERYINNAAAIVTLQQSAGNRIYVLGKVNNPGVFPFSKNLDVVQALSLAGGVSRFAELGGIRIIRREGQAQTAYRFNYNQVERGRNLDQNIVLRSGDVVMVP